MYKKYYYMFEYFIGGFYMYCRNCGEQIDSNAAICVKCGFAKGTGVKYCANCGKEVVPGANVCTNCGFAIDNTPNINPETQKSKMTFEFPD